MHQIKHETYRKGLIGNCISTPRHTYLIGSENALNRVKCITFQKIANTDLYTVYWEPRFTNKVIDNHR